MRISSRGGAQTSIPAWILAGVLVVLALGGTGLAQAPVLANADPPLLPAPAGLTGGEVLARVLEHNKLQNALLRQYSEVRTYEVRNTKGQTGAQAVVEVTYRAPGKKTFHTVSKQGSWLVRHMVFDRLISVEEETASGSEHRDSAITADNYTFTLLGEQDLGPYRCFVVQATPKTRSKYLFEGRIWVDREDFAIVRIAGHPAGKLSFWIHRVEFVRQYQRIGWYWLPYEDNTCADVRIYGKRLFTIDHRKYAVNGQTQFLQSVQVPAGGSSFCRGDKRGVDGFAEETNAKSGG